MRCSGARAFLTPSHVAASFTAAMVVRSLWAALGEVCVVGLVVDRLVVCGLVVGSVVVAVGMSCALNERLKRVCGEAGLVSPYGLADR